MGGPRVPQKNRSIVTPAGSPNEPKIIENGSRNFSHSNNHVISDIIITMPQNKGVGDIGEAIRYNGKIWGRCWDDSGSMLRRFWNDFGMILGNLCFDSVVSWGRCFEDLGSILWRFCVNSGTIDGSMLDRFWDDVGPIWGRFWDDCDSENKQRLYVLCVHQQSPLRMLVPRFGKSSDT